jgi:hypothetical protein
MQPGPTNVSSSSPIGVPSSQPSLATSSKRLVPWLIAVAFFMESLDTTILRGGLFEESLGASAEVIACDVGAAVSRVQARRTNAAIGMPGRQRWHWRKR